MSSDTELDEEIKRLRSVLALTESEDYRTKEARKLCRFKRSNYSQPDVIPDILSNFSWTPPPCGAPQFHSVAKYSCAVCLGKECDECRTGNPKMIVNSTLLPGDRWVQARWIHGDPFERTDEDI